MQGNTVLLPSISLLNDKKHERTNRLHSTLKCKTVIKPFPTSILQKFNHLVDNIILTAISKENKSMPKRSTA